MTTELAKRESQDHADPVWAEFYKDAVYFVAGIYAAEQVRTAQRWAHDRGSSLTAQEIAETFADAAKYMTDRIQRTSGTLPRGPVEGR